MGKGKNKFTLRIMISYFILAGLACLSGFFILSEIRTYTSTDTADENDTKLLKTGTLLTEIYEAESLSKQALQTRSKKNFNAYELKIDSILVRVDSLKLLSESDYQKSLLDSLQFLLQKKVANSDDLRKLKIKNNANSSIDSAIEKFDIVKADFGIITPEMLAPNFKNLSIEVQNALRKWADYHNGNIPKNKTEGSNSKTVDSILTVSKKLLEEARIKEFKTQRSLERKEIQMNRNDLELSQQLRNIIAAFEREILVNTFNTNIKKQSALQRSIRLAGFTALIGFLITAIFTFLINRDFWKVQTFREKLEKEKQFSESLLKSREQLIAAVSHDLRTPLNTISGYSELIENTGLTDKQQEYIKNVKSASGYVNDLVNDLLDFSKLEAGQLKIEEIPFILSDILKETAYSIAEIYKNKTIELTLTIDKKLELPVLGDPFRIRQILNNLIGNAYKFTTEGCIKIKALVIEDKDGILTTKISVSDTGIGIKKEKQASIFKEFNQADTTTNKKYGGYGLGLTISKKLTELLKGSIALESEEHKGSVFAIKIPLRTSKNPLVCAKNNTYNLKSKLSILLIDDDSTMLQLLNEVCTTAGIKIHSFSDFNQVKTDLKIQYNLVLTDIQMPTVDGFKVLKKLKSGRYEHYLEQPLIAMTGRRDLEPEVYTAAGFAQVLKKPFSKEALFTILSDVAPLFFKESNNKELEIVKNESNLFDLTLIYSFLGKNTTAANEVLETFITETSINIKELKTAAAILNYTAINSISHKMLPMIRQLKATEIIPILERFEHLENDQNNTLKSEFNSLKNKLIALELALKDYLS